MATNATETVETQNVYNIELRPRPRVTFDETSAIDNEHMNKKKSKSKHFL